ncbi:OmpA family protein [Seonamhaeicola marinus]|uniref:OmpA family protein n=1 Tax=Seonamhaeicola marinus TaxID=1912246 RepID=A0A5D0HJD2_9FLAO|nr:OmpA family protein [Seonamhaeicola marinus]TYA70177.1 OmpA family protein [Seonamhaeicola marinus]
MKFLKLLSVLCLLTCFTNLNAQNTFDILFPQSNRDQVCQSCTNIFRQKPKEIRFTVEREGANLYFRINDKKWFNMLFKNAGDGIAVDVVRKRRYDCNETVVASQIKGLLLKPVYGAKLRGMLKPAKDDMYRVHVGRIPSNFLDEELEYNILFLSNKNMCRYQTIYNLEAYPWELLDMGMYLDSLTYNTKQIKPSSNEGYVLKNKTLKFTIPFKKNKSEYSQEDIKPIYDSLRLTDFNIKTIKIKAYSSVEGSLERNVELQEQRASSIANALQSFQKPTIKTQISSSENWVEFLNDIKNTKYSNLSALSKTRIKSKLVGAFSKEMEPILKHHRKALLELGLEKKDRYKNLSESELLSKFNEAISKEDLDVANEIQNSIFEKLKNKEISPDFLRKMNIPKQAKFAKIFNKNSAYRYMLDVRQALIVYNELSVLEEIVPKNGEVKYNIAAIKIKLWRFRAIEIDETKLKNQINALKNYGIDASLVSRMMVNFHIIKAENLMRKRDFKGKDASVSYIHKNYNKFVLSDYDYLSLAQFFSYYANTDMAVELLDKKVRTIDIDENLLFYYLNLTLINNELTHQTDYRTMMLNAININKERFCKLFNAVENGGVTFQLLENEYLKDTYCENCND